MGRVAGTAWRVGPDNKMFANNHCVESQSELGNTEFGLTIKEAVLMVRCQPLSKLWVTAIKY